MNNGILGFCGLNVLILTIYTGTLLQLELQYLHDYAGISTNFGLTASPVVNFAGVFGTKSLAVGTDIGFDTATGKFVKYNAGVSYKDVDYTVSLTV